MGEQNHFSSQFLRTWCFSMPKCRLLKTWGIVRRCQSVRSTINKQHSAPLTVSTYPCPPESKGFITKWAQRHRHCTSSSVFNRWGLTPENHPLQADYLFYWAPTAFLSSSVWRACRANKRKLNDMQMRKKKYTTFVFQLRKDNSQTMLGFLWCWGTCNRPKWAKKQVESFSATMVLLLVLSLPELEPTGR